VFSVASKGIKVKVMPPLDEDFVKNLDKYESLDDVRADIRKAVEEEKKAAAQSAVMKALVDKLLETNKLDVPETIVERQIYSMMLDAQRRMTANGMEPRKAAEIAARMRDRFKGDAERIVKTSLVLESIAEKESIRVEEADLEARMRDMASRFGQPYEDVKKAHDKEDMRESLAMDVREQKTLDFIEGKAKINIVKKKANQVE
jgi:trigger factor